MYNPTLGIFISRDPIEADENLYRYCGNDPIANVDPSGLDFEGNRPLQGIPGFDHSKPEPNYPNNHTFRYYYYYYDKYGKLHLFVYSWGTGDKRELNGWVKDYPLDVETAKRDIKAGHVANGGKSKNPDPKHDAALDAAIDLLRNDPNSGSGHINMGPLGDCKTEAEKLDNLAEIIKKRGKAAGRKQLAENIWLWIPGKGWGWVPRGDKLAKDALEAEKKTEQKLKELGKKVAEGVKEIEEDAKKAWEGFKGIFERKNCHDKK
jgi:hypothetical protein